jgi:hypothetical protein
MVNAPDLSGDAVGGLFPHIGAANSIFEFSASAISMPNASTVRRGLPATRE